MEDALSFALGPLWGILVSSALRYLAKKWASLPLGAHSSRAPQKNAKCAATLPKELLHLNRHVTRNREEAGCGAAILAVA